MVRLFEFESNERFYGSRIQYGVHKEKQKADFRVSTSWKA